MNVQESICAPSTIHSINIQYQDIPFDILRAREIQILVLAYYNMELPQIKKTTNDRKVVFVRYTIAYLLRKHTNLKWVDIANYISITIDHTISMKAANKFTEWLRENDDIETNFNILENFILSNIKY